MNVDLLKGKIVGKGLNIEKFAELINIERSSMYRKLNSFEKITIGEAARMKKTLEMTDEEAIEIFFS